MSNSTFKTVVKEHIENVSLSEQQLTELQKLIPAEATERGVEADLQSTRKRPWISYALVASLGVLFGILLNQQLNIVPAEKDFIQIMAAEVARIFKFATRELSRKIAVAGDAVGRALIRE